METVVRVKGLTGLQHALKRVGADTSVKFTALLLAAAEPVRRRAETLSAENITKLQTGDRWDQMRSGVFASKFVYIAPRARGSRSGPRKRPTFGPMLLHEMEEALVETAPEVYALVEVALDRLLERDFYK